LSIALDCHVFCTPNDHWAVLLGNRPIFVHHLAVYGLSPGLHAPAIIVVASRAKQPSSPAKSHLLRSNPMSTHPNLVTDNRDVPQNNENLFSRTAQQAGEKMSQEAQTIPQALAIGSKRDEGKSVLDFSAHDIYKPTAAKTPGGDDVLVGQSRPGDAQPAPTAANPGADELVGQTRPGDAQPAPTAANPGADELVGQTRPGDAQPAPTAPAAGDVGQNNGDGRQIPAPAPEVKPVQKPAPVAHKPHAAGPAHDTHVPHGQKPAPAAEVVPTAVTQDNTSDTSAALLNLPEANLPKPAPAEVVPTTVVHDNTYTTSAALAGLQNGF
jgi:hypothetical protein